MSSLLKHSFVYLLLDPLNYYAPFYLGKGSKVSRLVQFRPRFYLLEALRGKTWRQRAILEGFYLCKCGCGIETSAAQRNRSANDRQKHGIAEWHFKNLPNNYVKSKKIKLLVRGYKEHDITSDMYLNNQVFKQIIGD